MEGAWSGVLSFKQTGPIRQKDYDAAKAPVNGVAYYDYYQTPSYGTWDLGIAYAFKNSNPISKHLKLQFNVFNLADSKALTSISTGATTAYDTVVYQTPRSYQATLKADF